MNIKVWILDSFLAGPGGGNPAGVVIDASGLSDAEMQEIARRVGVSETAFVMRSDRADFRVRFFTPSAEVSLCGHATIAAFALLRNTGRIKPGKIAQETGAGTLGVRVWEDGTILMDQALPEYLDEPDSTLLARTLGIGRDEIGIDEIKPRIVSTGLRDVLIPVRSLETLMGLKPDMAAISKASEALGVVGYHVFTTETLKGGSAHCRNFAPLYGIPEESATGTSNGALACHLFSSGAAKAGRFVMEQGYSMGKPSEIVVEVDGADRMVHAVRVGGRARTSGSMTVEF